jgi:hypothetical protein
MLLFFYILTFGIIIFYSFCIPDMMELINGNISLIMRCRKIFLNYRLVLNNNGCRSC